MNHRDTKLKEIFVGNLYMNDNGTRRPIIVDKGGLLTVPRGQDPEQPLVPTDLWFESVDHGGEGSFTLSERSPMDGSLIRTLDIDPQGGVQLRTEGALRWQVVRDDGQVLDTRSVHETDVTLSSEHGSLIVDGEQCVVRAGKATHLVLDVIIVRGEPYPGSAAD